jgi:hypothetical protein
MLACDGPLGFALCLHIICKVQAAACGGLVHCVFGLCLLGQTSAAGKWKGLHAMVRCFASCTVPPAVISGCRQQLPEDAM